MESQYPKILVYQDAFSNSTSAISHAFALAEKGQSRITVIDVVPPLSALWDEFETDYWELQQQVRWRKLDTIVNSFNQTELFDATKVFYGPPATRIIKEALKDNYSLVIKEAHSGKPNFFFGSLDKRLVRQCPVPILLTNAKPPAKSHRVLVAVDPAGKDSEKKLNENLIDHASRIAETLNSRLYIVGAWQSPYFAGDNDIQYLERFEKYEKRIRQEARAVLKELATQSLKPLKGPEDIILEKGSPDDVIIDAVEKVKPDLLVIGSVARSGLSGFLLGNTAERVLQLVHCSVLIVSPADFGSPLASSFA